MTNARREAVTALQRIHEGGYSHIVLETVLEASELTGADRALFTRLVYGVTERRLTLDYLLERCCSGKWRRLHPLVQEILRTGAYQLLFMDRIPASAAVNEAVLLTRSLKLFWASGLVNAVLRRIHREGTEPLLALPDTLAGNSIRWSCPEELLTLWSNAYGEAAARALAQDSLEAPRHSARVNTLKTDTETLCKMLTNAGVPCEPDELLQNCISFGTTFEAKPLAQSAKNWYYHQDRASQLCCAVLGAQPGERIADVCAAPGGKSMTLAQMMQNRGTVLACDLYEAKCATVARRAEEYGITCMEVRRRDAAAPCEESLKGTFDRVLCDVPCSGLGVIRRKPEIRYKALDELAQLPELQYRILCASAELVRPGGRLQYSTCTLNPAENQEVVERFLSEHPAFEPVILPLAAWFAMAGQEPHWYVTLLPHIHKTDGFFIAALQRKA